MLSTVFAMHPSPKNQLPTSHAAKTYPNGSQNGPAPKTQNPKCTHHKKSAFQASRPPNSSKTTPNLTHTTTLNVQHPRPLNCFPHDTKTHSLPKLSTRQPPGHPNSMNDPKLHLLQRLGQFWRQVYKCTHVHMYKYIVNFRIMLYAIWEPLLGQATWKNCWVSGGMLFLWHPQALNSSELRMNKTQQAR